MSYGLSCIASNIPGNRNIGLDEERFFDPGNIEQITSKIVTFTNRPISDSERREQINMIAEKYNWVKIADQTLDVYRSVCPH